MAATFSNPRLSAIPAERMRGASFADNFVTLTRVADNKGTDTGTGNAADHKLVVDGNGYISYDLVLQPYSFSVMVKFSTSIKSTGILICNASLITGASDYGFCIWVDAFGIKASNYDGSSVTPTCRMYTNYADGEIHTVTYVVDMDAGTHKLYVDDIDPESESTTVSGEIGADGPIVVGGNGTHNFVGTIYKARVFDQKLTSEEHDVYYADTLTSFMDSAYAIYRCDEICNRELTRKIWDRLLSRRDLTSGDGSTSTTFPTFDTDWYEFDGVSDYVSGFPTLPSAYTITAALEQDGVHPHIQQDNDTTLIDLLTVAGGYSGRLHSLIIHPTELTTIQQYHDEYQHLYWVDRSWVHGIFHRLIVEDTCKLFHIFNKSGVYRDWTGNNEPTHHDTALNSEGVSFSNSDSNIEIADQASLRFNQGSIVIFGSTTHGAPGGNDGYLVDKGNNYSFRTNVSVLSFMSSTIVYSNHLNYEQLAVTFKDGFKPRFYIDGEYIGEGSATVTLDDTDTSDLIIGNNNAKSYQTDWTLNKAYVGNKPLSDAEILAMYEQREIYGTENNMSKGYFQTTGTGAAAIAMSVTPGDDFDVPLITIKLSAAPTSAGEITVSLNSEAGANYDTVLRSVNPVGETEIFIEDLIGFQNGDAVDIAYANPDSRTWYATVNYEV